MVEIAVEEIIRMTQERKAVLEHDFMDIAWTYKGKPLDVPHKLRENFYTTGLNNIDFITSDYIPNRPWNIPE